MKATGIVSATILSLLLGTAALAYAQEDRQDKPAPQDEKAQKDKPAKEKEKNTQQQDKNNTNQSEKNARQQNGNTKQEEKSVQQQDRNNKQEEKNSQQQNQNNRQEQNNRQQQNNTHQAQRTGNGGGRIPEDRFRASFGREHSFRVNQGDYSRDRRFQYGGYSFQFVDAWPSNWLYTQDVFVVEIGGMYYLCNPMYPGVNITLNIVD